MRIFYILIFVLGCCAPSISGARILGLFPFNGKSHWNFFQPLLVGLAEEGHDVTVVGHFPEKNPPPKYKHINIAGTLPNVVNNISLDFIFEIGMIGSVTKMFDQFGYVVCDIVSKHPKVKQLAESNEKYDLVITEIFGTDCWQPFAAKFDVPLIGMISSAILPHAADMIDLPEHLSYVPTSVSPFTHEMNLFERTINVLLAGAFKLGYHFISRKNTEVIARRMFPNMPPLLEISNNISLIITNSHFSINGARPGVPALVEVGGLHISEPKPLPTDLAKILDNASDGVVYFCLGSLVRSETLPPKTLQALIASFGSLKETVLWKIDGKIPENLPKNIVTYPWLPQLDVLCHPNVKVFITHGGLGGTQESIYCGVPMIGIPLFGDQHHNINNYQAQGLAIYIDLNSITEDVMKTALNELLFNPMYKANAVRASEVFKDRPLKPLETAIYWVEYVIRHKGAPHLRTSAKNLNWFQYFLLDVFALILVVLYISFVVFRKIFKSILRLFVKKSKAKEKKN